MKRRPYLVWYVKNPEELSAESIVEHTLNYGDWDDVQKLIAILGIKKMARIFKMTAFRKRTNYHNITKHYFNLYFNNHAKFTA